MSSGKSHNALSQKFLCVSGGGDTEISFYSENVIIKTKRESAFKVRGQYDLLAATLRKHLDMKKNYEILKR